MVIPIMLRKLLRDVTSRKGSFLALSAIVAVGVGIYVSMMAVYLDLDRARAEFYRVYRLADFFVSLKRAPEWTLNEVRRLPNIANVRGRIKIAVLVNLPGVHKPLSGMALSLPEEQEPDINRIRLTSGSLFSNRDAREVVLDKQFAAENSLKPGDRIKVLLLDKQHDLLIVGTAMSPEFVYLIPPGGGLAPDPAHYAVMYLPRRFMQESCDLEGAYNELVGIAHDSAPTVLKNTLKLIEDKLDPYGVTIATQARNQVSVKVVHDELINCKATAEVMPVIFLGVAALVLNVLIGRIVAQDRTVIGTLRALGYTSWGVALNYIGFGLIICGIGGVAGLLLGLWLQNGMLEMYRGFFAIPDIQLHFYPSLVFSAIGIALIFGVIGTIGNAMRSARLEPAESMRPPPPEKGGRAPIELIPFLASHLSFRVKMMLRAIFRNPFRSSVSLLAAAVATALLVATNGLNDGLNYMIEYQFKRIAHEDLTVSLRDPRGKQSWAELGRLPNIMNTEPQLGVMCDLRNGPFEQRTAVVGLPNIPHLHTPLDSTGRPIVPPDAGLVFPKKLAQILNVEQGDEVSLRPLIARREEVTAPVVATIDTFLGLSAYCSMTYLSKLLGEELVAETVLAATQPGGSDEKVLKELQKRPDIVGIGDRKRSYNQMVQTMGEFMGIFLFIMVIFSGVIAFGSILNNALVSISERQREVGTFRVLGYSSGQITRMFALESFILNGCGILLGLGLGIWLTHVLVGLYDTDLYRFPAIVQPSRLLLVAALMLIIVGVAQIVVHRLIRSLNWLDVMKVKE